MSNFKRALLLVVITVLIPACGGRGSGTKPVSTGTGGNPGGGPVAGNVAPTVAIVSPTSGTSILQGTSIPIRTAVSDPDGTVVRVVFLNGSTVIGAATQAPFAFTWQGAPAGSLSLTA